MKARSSFRLISSLAVLSAAPIAVADEVAVEPQIAICREGPVDFQEEPVIIVCPGIEELPIDPVIIDEEGEGSLVEEETFVEEEAYNEEETFEEEVTHTEEEVTDGEVVEVTDGGEGVDPEILEDGEGFVIPLDWIKRGGGDTPHVYYSVTNFGGPEATPTTVLQGPETSPIARQIGPDTKATAIERRENAVFQAKREKKGPVALVKEGRVFLR